MLTARGRPEDVLRGFESGADDYLPKPFELSILLARLRGLLRRREWLNKDHTQTSQPDISRERTSEINVSPDEVFDFRGRTVDFTTLEIRFGDKVVRLTSMEAELLRYLIKHAGKIVSRNQVLEDVWNLHEDTDTRAIDNFIVRLRRYLEDEPTKPQHLLTVRGVGYRFVL
jgi:DNA-binding response OmpR family regulator